MTTIKYINRSKPINCPHCCKEIIPYYIQKNKTFDVEDAHQYRNKYKHVNLCACPECKKVFVIERK